MKDCDDNQRLGFELISNQIGKDQPKAEIAGGEVFAAMAHFRRAGESAKCCTEPCQNMSRNSKTGLLQKVLTNCSDIFLGFPRKYVTPHPERFLRSNSSSSERICAMN